MGPLSRLCYNNILDAFLLTIFFSNVESLKQGIVKTFKHDVQAPYTILLVGETGVGKSAFLEFLINVLIGNSIHLYNFKILDRTNEQGGSGSQSPTNSARFYEFRTKSGIIVSSSGLDMVNGDYSSILLSFAFLIRLDWPTLAAFNKMKFTRGALQMKYRSTLTPSMPFSFSPMALSLALLSAPTIHSPLCPPFSPKPWLTILPSFLPIS